jgi:hypothetical protein
VTLGDGSGAQNTLEEVPHDLILDRVYVHGHSNLNVSRCVALNSAATAVIDSYLSECHARGFDSQAIGGWNGPGPFKIVNNYLEGSGENVMFGGADPAIQGLVPSDIEMRRNHFNKPLSWRGDWTAKNLLELKLGRRVWIDGNVFEHSWADAQVGFAILAWSVNQSGGAPWSVTEDITFTNNLVRHAAGGFNLAAKGGSPSQTTARVKIANNVFEDIDASTWGGGENGRLFQLLGALRDVKINHNTGFASASIIVAEGSPQTHFTFRDNIVDRARYGIIGTGTGEGLPTLTAYMPDHDLLGNLIIGGEASLYPPGNAFPANTIAVRFVNFPDGNYRLMTDSPYKGAATDGEDPGADMDAVETATAGVAQ